MYEADSNVRLLHSSVAVVQNGRRRWRLLHVLYRSSYRLIDWSSYRLDGILMQFAVWHAQWRVHSTFQCGWWLSDSGTANRLLHLPRTERMHSWTSKDRQWIVAIWRERSSVELIHRESRKKHATVGNMAWIFFMGNTVVKEVLKIFMKLMNECIIACFIWLSMYLDGLLERNFLLPTAFSFTAQLARQLYSKFTYKLILNNSFGL